MCAGTLQSLLSKKEITFDLEPKQAHSTCQGSLCGCISSRVVIPVHVSNDSPDLFQGGHVAAAGGVRGVVDRGCQV